MSYLLTNHRNGLLVNRKPLFGGFFQLKVENKRKSARKSAWNKKAMALVKKLGL